ncbi:MAG: MATE family efflux transporter [Thermoclostridium sp.]|nr:MATE family efflux transporter [Thermoclostridium sp.]
MIKYLTGDREFNKTLIQLALPIALQNLIMTSLNLVDTVMVGQLGEANIAAVALGNQIFFLISLFLFGVSSGSSVFIAQFWGKRDVLSIRKVLGLSLICGFSVSFLAMITILLFPAQILSIFSKDPEVIRIGSEYLTTVCFCYIPTAISFCFASTLRSTGQAKLPVFASAIALSVNTLLNYILIFGKLGFPAMGAKGAAIATVIARLCELIMILGAVYAMKLPPAASLRELTGFNRDFITRFFRLTVKVILNEVLWSLGVTMYTVAYGRMGTDILAAVNISSAVEKIAFVLFNGMANACAVMVGNKIGEGDEQTAFLYAKRLALLGPLIGVILGVSVSLSSGLLLSIYNVSEEVYRNAVSILTIFGLMMPIKIFNMINIVGILRSGGDAMFSLIIDTTGVWFIAVPLVFVGGLVLQLPLFIVYLMVNLEEVYKVLLGIKRFLSGKWINNVVKQMA